MDQRFPGSVQACDASIFGGASGSGVAPARSLNGSNAGRVYPDGTVGMSKGEFVRRKFMDRVKSFWYRSGEILRSMSSRKELSSHEPGKTEKDGPPVDLAPPALPLSTLENWSEDGVSVDYASTINRLRDAEKDVPPSVVSLEMVR